MSKPIVYDLEERTTVLSENIIQLCKAMEKNILTTPLISQLIRSGTSIGANYSEANGASSKKDFINKIYLCKKETKETLYWLRLLGKLISDETVKGKCRVLWKETHELLLIFSRITSTQNKL